MFLDRTFHTETITLAFPEFAEIPFEEKNVAAVLDFPYFRRLSRDIFRFSGSPRNRMLTNWTFFLPRFLRIAIQKNYSRAATEFGEQAIHLLQLERL
jgi:hypothetical protein